MGNATAKQQSKTLLNISLQIDLRIHLSKIEKRIKFKRIFLNVYFAINLHLVRLSREACS